MPKKVHVKIKKEIESLMHENCSCEFCLSKPDWKSIWESAFNYENIWKEGNDRVIVDFSPTDTSIKILNDCYNRIDKAVELASGISDPTFFDYLLGDVNICGNYKTYNKNHVWTEKKYFDVSHKKIKKHFTDRLLLGLVNVAPEGSQAFNIRNKTTELCVLGFAGAHTDFQGVHGCVVDLKYINNFSNITQLSLFGIRDWKNTIELKKLKKLEKIEIEGSSFRNGGDYDYPRICKTNITEKIPHLKSLKSFSIEDSNNSNLDLLEDNLNLEELYLSGTKIKSLSTLLNMLNLKRLGLRKTNYLPDISGIENCITLERISIAEAEVLLDLTACQVLEKIKDLSLTKLNASVDLGCLKNLTFCEFLELNLNHEIDISFIRNLVSLKEVYISGCDLTKLDHLSLLTNLHQLSIESKGLVNFSLLENNKKIQLLQLSSNPNLQTITGLEGCINLKKIDLRNTKKLHSVIDFPALKCLDIKLSKSGIQNLDFLENTQIITEWSLPVHLDFEGNWSRAGFYVSSRHDSSDLVCQGGLPLGFDKDGYVIPEKFDDGSVAEFLTENTLDLSYCENLQNVKGLKNVTNCKEVNLQNCISLQSLDGLSKMLDLRKINLENCESLESLHALKNCKKLVEINAGKCNNISPKPRVKQMNTRELVQEYLDRL